MAEQKLTHSTFAIDRCYRARPPKVFRAFADPDTKARWFDAPGDDRLLISSAMDFREGGVEHSESRYGEVGPVSRFDALPRDRGQPPHRLQL